MSTGIMELEIMAFVVLVPIPVPIPISIPCRGSNVKIYKWSFLIDMHSTNMYRLSN